MTVLRTYLDLKSIAALVAFAAYVAVPFFA
jgi:hypothetical protein